MASLFGSTYICEQTFSILNINKSKTRNRLSHEILESILKLATTKVQQILKKFLNRCNIIYENKIFIDFFHFNYLCKKFKLKKCYKNFTTSVLFEMMLCNILHYYMLWPSNEKACCAP